MGGGGRGNGHTGQQQQPVAEEGEAIAATGFQRGLDSGLAKAAPSATGDPRRPTSRFGDDWNFSVVNVFDVARRRL